MKKLLRKTIPQNQRRQLRGMVDAMGQWADRMAGHAVNILPPGIKVFLKSHLKVVKRMDYSKGRILLDVASSMEYRVRTNSCRKEPETVEWIETFFKDKDVFFDIGANVGAYSLLAAAYFKGKVSVYAFEPSFLNFPRLCNNIHINGFQETITPFNIAFSDKTAVDYFNYRNLIIGGATHTLGEAKDEHNHSFVPAYRQATLAYAMDEFIKQLNLPVPQHIKLDVDGNEWVILQGARKTLQNPLMKSLLIELGEEDTKIPKFLEENGFSLHAKYPQGVPEAKLSNCIFRKNH
ncbi:MAG: FkbM family methyltransferase [Candidatus Omnitrophica bacterium]|nr:FkbM family methyltransferase [Candidatus Omnitrophota bacterium]